MNAVTNHANVQCVPHHAQPRQRPEIATRHAWPLRAVALQKQRNSADRHDQIAHKQKSARTGDGVDVFLYREIDAPDHDEHERGSESDSGAFVLRGGGERLHVGDDFREPRPGFDGLGRKSEYR